MGKRIYLLFTAVIILLIYSCTTTEVGDENYGTPVRQVSLDRVDDMPDMPSPYMMKDWDETAKGFYPYVFDFGAEGDHRPFIWMDSSGRNIDQPTFGIYTAVGDVRQGPEVNNGEAHEGLCILGILYSGSLMGIDFSNYQGKDFITMSRNYFNSDLGWNIIMNFTNPSAHVGGGYGNDWWYDVYNNMLFFAIGDQYPDNKGYEEIMRIVADQYLKADSILGDNYSHSYFDFKEMTGKTNHIVTQEDAAAGFAWLLYSAYQRFGDERYLDASRHALEVLLSQKESRFYEILMPFGAYIAARMNAEHGADYDVKKLLDWTFDGTATNRIGWGVINGNWGGYDVHGIVGSTVHNGGYGFLMNTFDLAWPLVPLVRYEPQYSDAIGKWLLNAANASRLFYPYDMPDSLQAIPGHKEVTKNLIAYEGLIKESTFDEYKGTTPFAQGDGPNWVEGNPPESMFSVYGSGHVGVFGSIIEKTDVEGILRLNCLATDLYRSGEAFPTFLYYNPYEEDRSVAVPLEGSTDLYDVISKRIVAADVGGEAHVSIPGGSSRLLVHIPAGTELTVKDGRLMAGEVVVDYRVEMVEE